MFTLYYEMTQISFCLPPCDSGLILFGNVFGMMSVIIHKSSNPLTSECDTMKFSLNSWQNIWVLETY